MRKINKSNKDQHFATKQNKTSPIHREQSPLQFDEYSPHSLRSNDIIKINKSDKDQICIVCNKWCYNQKDFTLNFLSCKSCPQSYHKRCIPIIYRSLNKKINCNAIKLNSNQCQIRCCSEQRKPKQLLEITDNHQFEKMNYIYNVNDEPIYYNPRNKHIEHKIFHQNNINNDEKYE